MKAAIVRRSAWVVLLAALAAASALAQSQGPPRPKRVLMLNGYNPHAPGARAFDNALRATGLGDSTPRVLFYEEVLDLDRFPRNAGRDELVN